MKILKNAPVAIVWFVSLVSTASAALISPTDVPDDLASSTGRSSSFAVLKWVNYALSLFGLVAVIVLLIGTIKILYQAFQKSFWQGILCLVVPFYIVYYFFKFYTGKKWWIILSLVAIPVVLLVFAIVNTGTSLNFYNFL